MNSMLHICERWLHFLVLVEACCSWISCHRLSALTSAAQQQSAASHCLQTSFCSLTITQLMLFCVLCLVCYVLCVMLCTVADVPCPLLLLLLLLLQVISPEEHCTVAYHEAASSYAVHSS
jgi:hypothetical protein